MSRTRLSDPRAVRLYRLFNRLADQALIGNAPFGGLGFNGVEQPLGKPHVDAGGFEVKLIVEGLELGEVEGGEVCCDHLVYFSEALHNMHYLWLSSVQEFGIISSIKCELQPI